jgi:hypothetical protein
MLQDRIRILLTRSPLQSGNIGFVLLALRDVSLKRVGTLNALLDTPSSDKHWREYQH